LRPLVSKRQATTRASTVQRIALDLRKRRASGNPA
jgi:hypothetical protein